MIVAEVRWQEIAHMADPTSDADRYALYTGAILRDLARLRFEVRLCALGIGLLAVAFIAHVIFFAAR